MSLRRPAYAVYSLLRRAARSSGQLGPLRRLVGPSVGRLLYKLSPGGDGPTQLHGHTMYLAPAGSYPPLDMAMARYEPGTTRLFQETVKPGMVVAAKVVAYLTLALWILIFAFAPKDDRGSVGELLQSFRKAIGLEETQASPPIPPPFRIPGPGETAKPVSGRP